MTKVKSEISLAEKLSQPVDNVAEVANNQVPTDAELSEEVEPESEHEQEPETDRENYIPDIEEEEPEFDEEPEIQSLPPELMASMLVSGVDTIQSFAFQYLIVEPKKRKKFTAEDKLKIEKYESTIGTDNHVEDPEISAKYQVWKQIAEATEKIPFNDAERQQVEQLLSHFLKRYKGDIPEHTLLLINVSIMFIGKAASLMTL